MKKNPVGYLRKLGCEIGEGCEIYPTANFMEPYLIRLGNHVRINEGVQLVTHDGGIWCLRNLDAKYQNADIFGKIQIGNNVHIGTNAIIMPGVTIGNNCVIGVSAVVTKDIPDNSVAVGIPARVIESLEDYIKKNESSIVLTKNLSMKDKKAYLMKLYHTNNA